MCVTQPFGKVTIGTAGLVLVPLFVAVSTFGSSNGSIFTASRLIFVGAREGELPDVLSGLHVTAKTPIPSILLQVWLI